MEQKGHTFFSYPSEVVEDRSAVFFKPSYAIRWIGFLVSFFWVLLFLYLVLLAKPNDGVSFEMQKSEKLQLKANHLDFPVKLNSFVLPFRTHKGEVEPKQIEVSLNLNSSVAKTEIEKSLDTIKRHLIFILSEKKDRELFIRKKKKRLLEEEVKDQLNMFLLSGAINKVQIDAITL